MPNSITLTGWNEFKIKLERLDNELLEEFDKSVEFAVKEWEGLAQRTAPKNFGFLAAGIHHKKESQGLWVLLSSRFYSPYMEWGTGSRSVIPPDLLSYAAQFWTHKVHVGIYPHPFFFIHKPFIEKLFIEDLKQIINTPR